MKCWIVLSLCASGAYGRTRDGGINRLIRKSKLEQRELLNAQLEEERADKRRRLEEESSNCTDSDTWHKRGDPSKDCAWVGSIDELIVKRMYVRGHDGTEAKDSCPLTCGMCDDDSVNFPACPSPTVVFNGDGKNEIFDPLTADEINSIYDAAFEAGLTDVKHYSNWMYGDEEGRYNFSNATWNKVTWMGKVELMPPIKAEAVAYLDADGPKPDRYAQFWLYRGAREPMRDSVLYKVGPLPISEDTMWTQQTDLTPDDSIPWPARPYDGGEDFNIAGDMIGKIKDTLDPLIQAFLGQMSSGDPFVSEWTHPDVTASDPYYSRIMNAMFFTVVDDVWPSAGGVIKPFPLSFTYNNTYEVESPMDFPSWNFVYCNQGPYESAEALLEAYESGEVETCPVETDYYESKLNTMKPVEPLRETYGDEPRVYFPSGMRVAVYKHAVEWQGWSFHVSATPQRGFAFYDVRFNGERIIYEMMATEYSATYSSARSMHNLYYSDGGYEMGGDVVPLYEDIDCPDGAIYMTAITGPNYGDIAYTTERAVCIFEAPQNYPLFRHAPAYDEYAGLPSTILVVRSVITIGNYDYVQDCTFFLDGRLSVAKSASGYSLGTYNDWNKENPSVPAFGQLFTNSVAGTLHVHQAAFKVDLDVAGSLNSFQTAKMIYGSYEDAIGYKPEHITGDGVPYFEKTIQPTETSFYKDAYDFFDIVSNETNAWGELKGYEIYPNSGIKNLYPEGHPVLHQINFTKYNVAVTVRKESEYVDTAPNFCFFSPLASPWDIAHYLDEEPIEGEDLVAWISMAKIHYPRSEDMPMPVTFSSSFDLKPHNYFDRGAYSDLPNVKDVVEGCAQVEGPIFTSA